jgi:hypothetical protein
MCIDMQPVPTLINSLKITDHHHWSNADSQATIPGYPRRLVPILWVMGGFDGEARQYYGVGAHAQKPRDNAVRWRPPAAKYN